MSHMILILDDDIQARDSLTICLEDEGFEVDQVGSSEEALEYLREKHADLVVVDLRLPGMDGPGFIDLAGAKWPHLKYIIFTGSLEYQMPAELIDHPNISDTIFLKPLFEFDTIIQEIRNLLQ